MSLRLFISRLFGLGADQRGAVLIKFTVALLPLLTVVGVALDLGQILLVKQKLTNAVDAAGIAVGRHSELGEDEVKALAQSFIVAHYPATALGDLKGVTVTAQEKQVDVTATASVPMTFLTILGYNSVDITASAMVLRQLKKVELVMVLDNSGSMAGSRMSALQSSANALISALFGTETTSKFVKIGLVPFTGAVNVGPGNSGADWIDSTGLSILHKEDVDLPVGKTLSDLLGSLTNASWGGCVRARLSGYDLTDEPPDAVETLFVPYVAPNEPSGCYVSGKFVLASKGFACTNLGGTYRDYANDYLSNANTVGFTPQQNQRNWLAYIGKTVPTAGTARDRLQLPSEPDPAAHQRQEHNHVCDQQHGCDRQYRHPGRHCVGLARALAGPAFHGRRSLFGPGHPQVSHSPDRRREQRRGPRQLPQRLVILGLRICRFRPPRQRRRLAVAPGPGCEDGEPCARTSRRRGSTCTPSRSR